MVIKEALLSGRTLLKEASVPDPETDVFLLLEAAGGFSRAFCLAHPEAELSEEERKTFEGFLARRAKREPCQYIIGSCEFYGLSFRVDRRVLIPRQDTEILVEEALKVLPDGGAVLDLCTGSGAVAVSLKHMRKDAAVTASDISEEALHLARENSRENSCEIDFVQSDLFERIDPEKRFDVILSNPPYITEREYETLMPEVKDHEPSLALLAGEDGLSIYRRLIKDAYPWLKPSGSLLVEIGCAQADAVSKLFKEAGFQGVFVVPDLAGLDRVVYGKKQNRN